MTTRDLDALTAALAGPAEALREAALNRRRGYRPRRRPPGGTPTRITLTARLIAAILHDRHGLPYRPIAALLGIRHEDTCRHTGDIRQLLHQTASTIHPSPVRLRTLDDLYRYATAHGITTPAKINTTS
jgi:hypothetical protein